MGELTFQLLCIDFKDSFAMAMDAQIQQKIDGTTEYIYIHISYLLLILMGH